MLSSSRSVARSCLKYYGPSMHHFANSLLLRIMATMTSQNHLHHQEILMTNSNWPQDPNFPLPGNVNIDISNVKMETKTVNHKYKSLASAFLELSTDTINKKHVLTDFIKESKEMSENEFNLDEFTVKLNNETFATATIMDSTMPNNKVEFKVQECPSKLRKQFNELFSMTLSSDLTVMTITQQTENDMSSWSEEVENERDKLTDVFIESAQKICLKIHNGGYWADFIDPSSGLAYHSENPNKTLCETDDCFNQLGFNVEDLGCCKVLQHKQWKNNVFVGVIFTTAPVESHVFELL